MKKFGKTLLIVSLAIVSTGCIRNDNISKTVDNISNRDSSYDARMSAKSTNELRGSLWNRNGNLYSDPKANRINDILTVNVIESASGEKEASTNLSKSSKLHVAVNNLFGLEKSIPASYPNIDMGNLIDTDTSSQFDGDGATSRKGTLKATVSVIITDILSNGNLVIAGEQNVRINDEEQVVSIEGTVRPIDITPENTIDSPKIANAKISYIGKGVIADKQAPGWGIKIFDTVWPF